MQNQIDGGIGEPDQPQHDSIAADAIQLIRFRNFQNHRFTVSCPREVDCGIGARELMLVLVRAANQSYASIVGNSSLFQSYELRDFHIGGVQSFQLLDVAGPHPRLVERTIIRERMFVASTRPEEDEHTEKHELVPHDSIVARTTRKTGRCAVRGTRAKGQVADTGPIVDGKNVFSAAINLPEQESQAINISVARLVDAFDAQNARNFLYVDENGFELALVGNLQIRVDSRIAAIRTALQVMNVGTSSADDGGDFSEKAGAVACADGELDGKLGFGAAAPLDGDAAFGLVHEILNIGTLTSMHGDTAAPRDVADNFVAGNGIATLGAVNEQVVVTFNNQGRFAEAQHALYCFNESGLGVDGFGLGSFFRFTEKAREDLTSGIFAETDGGVKILNFRKAVIVNQFEDVGFRNFLEAAAKMTRFVFEQALAHFGGFFAFLLVDPMTNLAFRRGGFNETEPIAAGVVALLGEDFDDIAAGDFMAQRNHLAVHLSPNTLVADLGVNHVGKIDGRGAARKLEHAAFRRESVDFDRSEIHFERGEKFSGLLELLGPFDELAHPGDALIVIFRRGLSRFVFPVRGNALLRDAVHFLRADLHLERLAAVEHGGMQRLIKIWSRNGDVVLEAARDGAPDVMDYAKRGVTVALGVRDDAHGEEIVDLAETDFLAHD